MKRRGKRNKDRRLRRGGVGGLKARAGRRGAFEPAAKTVLADRLLDLLNVIAAPCH